jgi:glycosyltransferase involved in cell wall biosynthesis
MIDLVWQGEKAAPPWAHGAVHVLPHATPSALHDLLAREVEASEAAAWLFWDGSQGLPDASRILAVLEQPCDVWHAGLRLGMGGAPGIIDFVHPTWMLNRDPDPRIPATSWRLSLRACLIRTDVLRRMGGPHPEFRSADAAALEMGHRYIQRGVVVRHEPGLMGPSATARAPILCIEDEVRFAFYRFGRRWARWAAARAWMTGYAHPVEVLRAWRRVHTRPRPAEPAPFISSGRTSEPDLWNARVSVLVPTLERYPYLHKLLRQLREQTVPPLEVVVVDQTAGERRDLRITERFPDLPLRVIYQDRPGQCSSRNAGLQCAEGDYVLFLDDDDEVEPDLIERHLAALMRHGADVISGVADEVGAGPVPASFMLARVSDVFPTNNTMVRAAVLRRSGLFDLAFDRLPRADRDLGTRVYLSGALMVLDPSISVLHHHVPSGGLRAHRARVHTRASSRRSLLQRHLPAASEIYLAMRYFTSRQVRELEWIRALGSFSDHRHGGLRLLKILVSAARLPDTFLQLRRTRRTAEGMLRRFPQIPSPERRGQHA